MFIVLEKYHQILLHKNMKAAPDESHFFLIRVNFLGYIIERKTTTPLKFQIDAIQKLQPLSNKKKLQEVLGKLNFLCKFVYKMQLYLKPFLRQQNIRHDLKKSKLFSMKKYQILFQIPINHFMPCVRPLTLASVQHHYNLITGQIK